MPAPSGAMTFLDAFVLTDTDGRFELASLVVEGSYLILTGAPILLSEHVALGEGDDLESLEVRVQAASRFRLVLADPTEADAFERIQPDGELLPLFVEVEGHTISTGEVAIVEGRSGVVQAAEGPLILKLSKGGALVRRLELVLAPGGVHDLRP